MSTKSAAVEMSEAASTASPAQVAPVTSRPSTSTTAGVPRDAVRLDLLLIGGQRHLFDFTPTTTVKEVRETVFDEWPSGECSVACRCWASRPEGCHLAGRVNLLRRLCQAPPMEGRISTCILSQCRLSPYKADGLSAVVSLRAFLPPQLTQSSNSQTGLRSQLPPPHCDCYTGVTFWRTRWCYQGRLARPLRPPRCGWAARR